MSKNLGLFGVAGIVPTLALIVSTLASGSDIVVSGNSRHQGVLQVGDGAPTTFETTTERYVLVAESVDVGTVIPLDHDLVQSLCKDVDGCAVVMQMVDKFGSQPGNVHSHTAHLFISETSNWWRLSEDGIQGQDDNDAGSQWDSAVVDECRLTDAETSTGIDTTIDAAPGFGLLNKDGGGTTDANSCRLMLTD